MANELQQKLTQLKTAEKAALLEEALASLEHAVIQNDTEDIRTFGALALHYTLSVKADLDKVADTVPFSGGKAAA